MNNQTTKNDPSNRYETGHLELIKLLRLVWQGRQGSNLRHPVLETGALPTELLPYGSV
jgi:hypothetical protein